MTCPGFLTRGTHRARPPLCEGGRRAGMREGEIDDLRENSRKKASQREYE